MDFAARVEPLRKQVAENPRLQAGLVLIGIVLLVWLLLLLGDWRAARLGELQAARDRLARVQQLANQHEWPERAAEAVELAELLSAEIPDATSPGLAQANFQGWLGELTNSQAGEVRVDVQAPVLLEQPEDILRINANLTGTLAPSRVVQLIQRIEARPQLTTIPVLTIRSDGHNQTFSITLHGYYRVPAAEAVQ